MIPDRERWIDQPPYGAKQEEKDAFFNLQLKSLTDYHRRMCAPYDSFCKSLPSSAEDCPLLPISAFRDRELTSVPESTIVRKVSSSGTTGQKPSRILLDAETAAAQQAALFHILSDFMGNRRMPMMILDTRDVFSDPKRYTARGAGIAGFAMLSTKRTFALDEFMQPDLQAIQRFAEENKGKPVLLFGFTYMIRQYFTLPLLSSGYRPDLSSAILIHGGGWKKMTDLAVSPEIFKAELKEAAGITRVHNYYGMTEQLGSIFMECEYGHLHASLYSDIHIRRPGDFSLCKTGEQGLIELTSFLPTSYPGHRILTADLGRILGTDTCPCGRKGVFFAVDGRLSNAELRGCSDTYADPGKNSSLPAQPAVLAGSYPADTAGSAAFSDLVMLFLKTLSGELLKDPACKRYPACKAFAFWCRESQLAALKQRYPEYRRGIGHAVVIAPSNMPVLFGYILAVILLSGCSCTIRLSERTHESSVYLCRKIQSLLSLPVFSDLQKKCSVLSYPHDNVFTEHLLQTADARIVWGSDMTVSCMSSLSAKPGCRNILFPDRYSIAVLSAAYISNLSNDELFWECDRFYKDTYEADQNACSSPRFVFWIHDNRETDSETNASISLHDIQTRWWQQLHAIVKQRYRPDPAALYAKYSLFVSESMQTPLKVTYWKDNLLIAAKPASLSFPVHRPSAHSGLFYEAAFSSVRELPADFGDSLQTVVSIGIEPEALKKALLRSRSYTALRIVPAGSALQFDPVWDNQDMIRLLSEEVTCRLHSL